MFLENQSLNKEKIQMIQQKSDIERTKCTVERTKDQMMQINHQSDNQNDIWSMEFKSIQENLLNITSQMLQIDADIRAIDVKAMILLSDFDMAFSLLRELNLEFGKTQIRVR